MPDLLKDMDELLTGWTRSERQIPDYGHLTETWWVLNADTIRHVEGKGFHGTGALLVQAVLDSVTHTLPNVDTLTVLETLIGGRREP